MKLLFIAGLLYIAVAAAQPRVEQLRGKTVLLFTPHPDDDTFCCAGTLAMLAKNGNTVRIVIYTNDDKGSRDPEMTSERLAKIRKAEEEEACRIIGDRKSTRLNSSHDQISYAVFCLKKKKKR